MVITRGFLLCGDDVATGRAGEIEVDVSGPIDAILTLTRDTLILHDVIRVQAHYVDTRADR
jgi:hypothetical protein